MNFEFRVPPPSCLYCGRPYYRFSSSDLKKSIYYKLDNRLCAHKDKPNILRRSIQIIHYDKLVKEAVSSVPVAQLEALRLQQEKEFDKLNRLVAEYKKIGRSVELQYRATYGSSQFQMRDYNKILDSYLEEEYGIVNSVHLTDAQMIVEVMGNTKIICDLPEMNITFLFKPVWKVV